MLWLWDPEGISRGGARVETAHRCSCSGGPGGGSGKVRGQQRGRQGVPLEMHLEGSDDE